MISVLIGVPSRDEWKSNFGMCLEALTNHSRPIAKIVVDNRQGSQVTANRNKLATDMLRNYIEWLLFLDDDMMFPNSTLERLLKHDKKIVGATYPRRAPPFETLGAPVDKSLASDKVSGLIEMEWMPLGCMLIHSSVFLSIPWPWFTERYDKQSDIDGEVTGEDHQFSELIRRHGHKMWCDMELSRELGHISYRVLKMTPKSEAA